jgi:N-acetylneuraminate synthase
MIAEVGINHNGSLKIAKKLIDASFSCSWNCVKFQKRNPDICVPRRQKNILKDTPWGRMRYIDYKKKIEFSKEEYDYIDAYCRAKPIDWTMSVWDMDSLEFARQYNLPFIKIPSAQITNLGLLKAASLTGIPVVVSTGMSVLSDIDRAVGVLKKHASQFVLMHCNSSYPAKVEELNLKMISELKKKYKCIVGYSGHEYGLDSTTIAVALGAKVIERHITLDHSMWGTDHSSSVEIQGMDKLYKQVRFVSQLLGDGKKRFYQSEKQVMLKLKGYKKKVLR